MDNHERHALKARDESPIKIGAKIRRTARDRVRQWGAPVEALAFYEAFLVDETSIDRALIAKNIATVCAQLGVDRAAVFARSCELLYDELPEKYSGTSDHDVYEDDD
jgi:hypothetical protein